MHEWGIAVNLIEKVRNHANINKIKKVSRAEVKLGKGLNIAIEEFRDCLLALAKDEQLKDCRFDIEEDNSKLASLDLIEGE